MVLPFVRAFQRAGSISLVLAFYIRNLSCIGSPGTPSIQRVQALETRLPSNAVKLFLTYRESMLVLHFW